jgi:cytochrome c1
MVFFTSSIIFTHSFPEAKNANGGVWPVDFSKLRMRPGGINYVYNILTGYHYNPPMGIDIPKGKSFNPYFDHMIIGMKRVSHHVTHITHHVPSSNCLMV